MQTVRLLTVIDAPVDRCYRLALHAGLARETMTSRALAQQEPAALGEMSIGEELQWTASRTGAPEGLTESLSAARERVFVRKSLKGGGLEWAELDQHFAPMNDGTRMREELRFTMQGWWMRGLRERRMRRSLLQMLTRRSEAVKKAAEGEDWKRYLGEG